MESLNCNIHYKYISYFHKKEEAKGLTHFLWSSESTIKGEKRKGLKNHPRNFREKENKNEKKTGTLVLIEKRPCMLYPSVTCF